MYAPVSHTLLEVEYVRKPVVQILIVKERGRDVFVMMYVDLHVSIQVSDVFALQESISA